MYPQHLKKDLEKRVLDNNYRRLISYPQTIDFFSNDYLGLTKNENLISIIKNVPEKLGSTGSRLLSGNTDVMEKVEADLAKYYSSESALFFSSGFNANLALFSTIAQKNDTIIYDQYIHASIREGIRLSPSRSFSFKHNDYEDLEKKIQQATGSVFLSIEGIYSMQGDSPNIASIMQLVEKYNVYLIIDEAHSVGILGNEAKGWSEEIPSEKIFAKVITFGKALGFHGALITGSSILKDYLVNFSKAFIYTTAPSERDFSIIQILHEFIKNNHISLRKPLYEWSEYFNQQTQISKDFSPIKIISNKDCISLQSNFLKNNIAIKLITHPTVEKGNEIIRVCLHNYNTKEELDLLLKLLHE